MRIHRPGCQEPGATRPPISLHSRLAVWVSVLPGVLTCKASTGQCSRDLDDRLDMGIQNWLLARLAGENLIEDEAVTVIVSPIRAGTVRRIDQKTVS